MSIDSKANRVAGAVKEQIGEAFNDQSLANEGRGQRNAGRMQDGKAPLKNSPDIHHAD